MTVLRPVIQTTIEGSTPSAGPSLPRPPEIAVTYGILRDDGIVHPAIFANGVDVWHVSFPQVSADDIGRRWIFRYPDTLTVTHIINELGLNEISVWTFEHEITNGAPTSHDQYISRPFIRETDDTADYRIVGTR